LLLDNTVLITCKGSPKDLSQLTVTLEEITRQTQTVSAKLKVIFVVPKLKQHTHTVLMEDNSDKNKASK